jgi:hypothetical protein
MPRPQQVKIVKDGQEGFCLESSFPAWERNGWTRADDGSSAEEAVVTKNPVETQAEAPVETKTRKAT